MSLSANGKELFRISGYTDDKNIPNRIIMRIDEAKGHKPLSNRKIRLKESLGKRL
jgi:hypothetical protein